MRPRHWTGLDRKSTRLNSSHVKMSYAVFCLKKKRADRLLMLVKIGFSNGKRPGDSGAHTLAEPGLHAEAEEQIGEDRFVFNDTATTEIYTLSLHDALPIDLLLAGAADDDGRRGQGFERRGQHQARSEEHTSELQSRENLVCRLLLEKK